MEHFGLQGPTPNHAHVLALALLDGRRQSMLHNGPARVRYTEALCSSKSDVQSSSLVVERSSQSAGHDLRQECDDQFAEPPAPPRRQSAHGHEKSYSLLDTAPAYLSKREPFERHFHSDPEGRESHILSGAKPHEEAEDLCKVIQYISFGYHPNMAM
jgi:hypothetical protein